MKVYELMPNDSRKSFYGKAKIIVDGNTETLKSYNTLIAEKNIDTGEIKRLWCGWSATTGRHIRAFCGMSKAEFMALPHEPNTYEKAAAYNGTLYR